MQKKIINVLLRLFFFQIAQQSDKEDITRDRYISAYIRCLALEYCGTVGCLLR